MATNVFEKSELTSKKQNPISGKDIFISENRPKQDSKSVIVSILKRASIQKQKEY